MKNIFIYAENYRDMRIEIFFNEVRSRYFARVGDIFRFPSREMEYALINGRELINRLLEEEGTREWEKKLQIWQMKKMNQLIPLWK